MIKKLFIGFFFVLIACNEKEKQEQRVSISIEEPLITEVSTDNPDLKIAIENITKLLKSKNHPTDSLYLKNYQIDSIPWTFHIQHYITFVYDLQWEREQKRVDSLLRIDSTRWIEHKMVPATGNISGYDRWIEYYPETGKLNDYLLQ